MVFDTEGDDPGIQGHNRQGCERNPKQRRSKNLTQKRLRT